MSIEGQAEKAAQFAEARQALSEAADALRLMAELARHQYDALVEAGFEQPGAERIVGQWWSDTMRSAN